MIITRTPLRITLCGGGTDLPSYYKHQGGLVATMAINKYIYITLKPDDFENLCKLRYSEIEIVGDITRLKNTRAREALKINNVKSVEINSCADLSSKSGLGSSGSFLVGLLNAIKCYKREDNTPKTLAEEACKIEIEILHEPVGKQDQYIAAFGGVQLLKIDTSGYVRVKPLNIQVEHLITNMRVYALDIYRNASDILSDQNKMEANTKNTMDDIMSLGMDQIMMLKNGDIRGYGESLDEYWSLKKQLSSKISLNLVDELYSSVKQQFNVLGGKIIGAGGGGFIMLYAEKNHEDLDTYMSQLGLKRLTYSIDSLGSTLLGNHL
jgi:D-glycero-alpha-D-manno-heptose-7-phosphate kinase